MRPNKIIITILLLIMISLIPVRTEASELGFSVQAILPDNQIDPLHTYFDLMMKPNQKQAIQVAITNDKEEDIQVQVYVNTAMTNKNGIIQYSETAPKLDSSLKTPFKSIAKTENIVTVPSKSTKNISVDIQMPQEKYDGIILGGLYFMEKKADKATGSKDNIQITNRYSYTIGVVLRESDTEVLPDLNLQKNKKKDSL
ncbi:DUF916 domain-containing protein [Listeria cornellensis]|uniref:WxL Interacting Protein peptidoglycan binding domain-containing protein n=1 Tax=Listeria cornellensis FSL F6-0969 TaxID=1265820 RepID=W7C0E2_9LIST|nr:DUF916 domain-containing protein [Listeria cornellensis]EUJ29116.1 hypothetical protein PCORN_11617 [Listeria cornellensis FSL F6-0969]